MSPARPWLLIAVAVALGGVLATSALSALLVPPILLLAISLLRRRPGLAAVVAALAAGVGTGAAQHLWVDTIPPPPNLPAEGRVLDVHHRGERMHVRIALDSTPGFDALAFLPMSDGIHAGDRVRLLGTLRRPDLADNPGGFDARLAAERDGIAWRLQGQLIRREIHPATPIERGRLGARRALAEVRHQTGAALLTGLLLGDRSAVPPEARRAFEATGTGHLLAVSGLHVGGIAFAVFGLFGIIFRRSHVIRPGRWAAAFALPAVWAFVMLAHAPLSARRAGIMVGGWLLGYMLDRRADALQLLGLAAAVVLAWRPSALAEVGFQLSFGAVLALLTLGRGRGLRGAIIVATVASMATAPIQAYHFGTVAPLSPLANLILTPLAAMILVPFGAASLLFAPISTVPLGFAAQGAEFFLALTESVADLSGGVQIVGAAWAPAVAIPLCLWIGWRVRKPRITALTVLGVAALTPWTGPTGVVDVIAVGQGDAILVRSGRQAMLIDTGPDAKARTLLSYLRHEGVRRLERLVISHAHPDHDGGAAAILAVIPVGEVLHNGRDLTGPGGKRLLRAARRHQIPVRAAQDGQNDLGALKIQIYAALSDPKLAENDASVAVRVEGPQASMMLLGDLELKGEAEIAPRLSPATVLKVAHHGSKTSTTQILLDAVKPLAAVFPVGRRNRYGFPHAAVISRLDQTPIWRTDVDGRIRVDLDARTVEALRRPLQPLPQR